MHPRWILVFTAVAGCATSATENPDLNATFEVSYQQDIKSLLDAKCGSCHVAGGIAPFALGTGDEAREHAAEIKSAVETRTMPPWLAAEGNESLRFDRSLSQAQIDLISHWVDDGAPEGNAEHPGEVLEVDTGGISRVDVALEMPSSYSQEADGEDVYRCFVLNWPESTTRYVTGFNAVPGNTRIVHHLVTFLVDPNQAELVEEFDRDDPGPGYSCFGGPSGEGAPQFQTTFFGQWAPGMRGLDFPGGSGIPVAPGSRVVLQVHYHPSASKESDRTVLNYRIDDTVQKRGYYVPWFDLNWYNDPKSMTIRAGDADAEHSYTSSAGNHPLLALVAAGAHLERGLLLHSVLLHMHTLGTRTSLFVEDANAQRQTLIDIPRWDFDWQNEYVFETPKLIAPGDKLGVDCHWNNTRSTDVQWGEGSEDEMCAPIVYLTEP
jgi:mono/diheme cytochrome c family protein